MKGSNDMTREYVVELRRNGKSISEVADIMNVSRATAKKWCREFGVIGRMSDRKPSAYRNQWNSNDEEQKARQRAKDNGLIYRGGYTSSEGYISVECCECGYRFDIAMRTLRQTAKGTRCPACRNAEIESYRQHKRKLKEDAQRAKDEAKAERMLTRLIQSKQIEMKYCVECGQLFIPQNTMARCCSADCIRRRNNRHNDSRLKKVAIKDYTITLKRLARRDKNICWLCGKVVDWNDYTVIDSTTIAGNDYPSIDHVQPLAKGGQHTWNNVRLAHRICNSIKSDTIVV